ncbi:MAG: aminopeptidase [Anaerolineae bacterium]|nr:MAG: aminopeptidase [Anaerolineae bacterium]
MTDSRLIKLAHLLVSYSLRIKPGDWVWVTSQPVAEPLIREVVAEIVRAGGNPTVTLTSDAITETMLRESSPEQLAWISPTDRLLFERADARINILGTDNTRALSNVDPAQQKLYGQARRELSTLFMERSARKEVRWNVVLYPCPAFAQEADMSLRAYEDFVYSACFCDRDDPEAEWNKLYQSQEHIVAWLKGKKQVTVKSPNADLTLSVEGRTFINSDGRANMPSGEVFTGPVETSANGWVQFTYPAIRGGREVEGVRLEFKDGKVVKASAKKNEAYLVSQLDSDEGARYLGEFAIGTNYGIQQFTKSILFDEKIGGSFHMAVGAGYPETGSVNKSAIHWDFICDIRTDSEIRVDGELLYKDGQFKI